MTDQPPAALERRFRDVVAMFRHRVAATPEREALRFPTGGASGGVGRPGRGGARFETEGDTDVLTDLASVAAAHSAAPQGDGAAADDGGTRWESLTWAELGARVDAIAGGLLALDLAPALALGDCCGIVSSTRYEWIMADLAILCAGCATTTVYPSTLADECVYILADAGCRVLFAESRQQLAKISERRDELPALEYVVLFDGDAEPDDGDAEPDADWVLSLAALERRGREHLDAHPDALSEIGARIEPEQLATLIYTSGTTGPPKGVRLAHDCWAYTGEAMAALGMLDADDLQYLWLPLSHSFGKMLLSGQLAIGFASAVDGKTSRLLDNLVAVQPTFMAAAPRLLAKVQSRVLGGVAERGPIARWVFQWAIRCGGKVVALRQRDRSPGLLLRLGHRIAKRLVFSRLLARLGGRLRFLISGSAPLPLAVGEFFQAADMCIFEGYGLTESSAASVVNRPGAFRLGSVGKPMPGTDIAISPDDGEVLLRSPGVMRGYHGLDTHTDAALDRDGWLRTGDLGELDEDGFLYITGRKKDLIKTAGGKYVSPLRIEGHFKALCPVASHMVVHGDRRNFCSALVALDEEAICDWAIRHGLANKTYTELTAHRVVYNLVKQYIDQLNRGLASHERIKRFALLPRDLSVEDGELTPSHKVKRDHVERKYMHLLDALYQPAATPR